jgi:hypothetical protein
VYLPKFNYTILPNSALTNPPIQFDKNSAFSSWTSLNHTFTANSPVSTIRFGISTGNKQTWYIDDVKAVATNAPNVSLLINGDFEYGNSNGWSLQTYSPPSYITGGVINSTRCDGHWCYFVPVNCNGYQFLQQSFVTTINQQYTVSFNIIIDSSGSGAPSAMQFAIA